METIMFIGSVGYELTRGQRLNAILSKQRPHHLLTGLYKNSTKSVNNSPHRAYLCTSYNLY